MTRQEIFNKIVTHLLTQKKKSVNKETGICMYKSPDNLKCAVGCLIPDEIYDGRIEGFDISTVYKDSSLSNHFINLFPRTEIGFVRTLMTIHDSYNPEAWHSALLKVANKYELTMPLSE